MEKETDLNSKSKIKSFTRAASLPYFSSRNRAGQKDGCLFSEVGYLTTLSVSKLYSVNGRTDGCGRMAKAEETEILGDS
jgi:hypothetical protein